MATEAGHGHSVPHWFVEPGEVDTFAWLALGLLFLAIYGLVTLYAAFDRWAEHKSAGTPLAKTIPTLLTIALLYEIFPIDHFSVLLPISAILIALMADWARYNARKNGEDNTEPPLVLSNSVPEPLEESAPMSDIQPQEPNRV